ncbi:MAG: hypothetical protein WCE94_00345 [Candidatus Methanoperedens sp.]
MPQICATLPDEIYTKINECAHEKQVKASKILTELTIEYFILSKENKELKINYGNLLDSHKVLLNEIVPPLKLLTEGKQEKEKEKKRRKWFKF